MTAGLQSIGEKRLIGPLRVSHIIEGSIATGSLVGRARRGGGRLLAEV